jgi:predicted nucleic acid-binding protein
LQVATSAANCCALRRSARCSRSRRGELAVEALLAAIQFGDVNSQIVEDAAGVIERLTVGDR